MMSAKEALAYLEGEIDDRIARFSGSSRFYNRGSLVQTVLTAVLGVVTTFLIGVNQIDKASWIAVLALLAAGLTTIAAAWLGWFGFRKLWVGTKLHSTDSGSCGQMFGMPKRQMTGISFRQISTCISAVIKPY